MSKRKRPSDIRPAPSKKSIHKPGPRATPQCRPRPGQATVHSPSSTLPTSASTPHATASKQTQLQHTEPTIPFAQTDRILLVGEGDLSFAHSLSTHHVCTDLTATTYDDETTTMEKYPQAKAYIAAIRAEGGVVAHGIDATKLHLAKRDLRVTGVSGDAGTQGSSPEGSGLFDRILFNFPHVGGKSTDANRQVRYNQELIVEFFASAMQILNRQHGTITVTLFEGEPYTLWNIRDLARHSGLQVQRSFRFQALAYPGYSHARTLGNIVGGGGWKGEDRVARSFVFEIKSTEGDGPKGKRRGKGKGHGMKKGHESSDDSDD